MIKQTKILIVDDHPIILSTLKELIVQENIFDEVFLSKNAKEAKETLEKEDIGFIISDISMPDINGLDLCKYIKKKYPQIRILVLSQFDDIQIIKPLIKIEVNGIITKSETTENIILSIKALKKGEYFYSQEINDLIIRILQNKEPNNNVIIKLSKRENQVLMLIAEEMTNKKIAEKLFISIPTVETYRSILLRKFEVKNSIGLIRKAMQLGFIS